MLLMKSYLINLLRIILLYLFICFYIDGLLFRRVRSVLRLQYAIYSGHNSKHVIFSNLQPCMYGYAIPAIIIFITRKKNQN